MLPFNGLEKGSVPFSLTALSSSFNNSKFIGGEGFSLRRVVVGAVLGGTASKLSGGKFANGAVTGAFSQALNGERAEARKVAAQKGDGFFKGLWKKATGWHFEGRDARNGNLPAYEQATGQGSEWTLLSPEQS